MTPTITRFEVLGNRIVRLSTCWLCGADIILRNRGGLPSRLCKTCKRKVEE